LFFSLVGFLLHYHPGAVWHGVLYPLLLGWSEQGEPLFYFLASGTAIPEPPEMEFIFPLDFRSYGFGDLPI